MAPARITLTDTGRTICSFLLQVATFVSSLASIAWLLNIRGHDVQFNPVVTSYLFVTTKQAILFVDKAKINSEVAAYLKEQGVSIREYADVWTFLRRAEWGDGKVCRSSRDYVIALTRIFVTRSSLMGKRRMQWP